jgi:hypothetical protein
MLLRTGWYYARQAGSYYATSWEYCQISPNVAFVSLLRRPATLLVDNNNKKKNNNNNNNNNTTIFSFVS